MKLNSEDFTESEFSSFEINLKIWKKDAQIAIDFPKDKKKDLCLKKFLPYIEKELLWIEKNKSSVEDFLIENNCLELAEEWASSAPLLECASEECYIMEDDQKVFFPITKEDFCNSLYIETLTMNFEKNKETASIELILVCNPDYFAGHCLIMNIDENKKFKYDSLAG